MDNRLLLLLSPFAFTVIVNKAESPNIKLPDQRRASVIVDVVLLQIEMLYTCVAHEALGKNFCLFVSNTAILKLELLDLPQT